VRYQESILSSLTTLILAVGHRPVMVGIDGHGGSGKSTLAQELADALSVAVAIVHGDDFYSDITDSERMLLRPEQGYENYFDWRRVRTEVLSTAREPSATLRYQRYDWDEARLSEWTEVAMPEVVIVEGVYTVRSELRDFYDVTVFVQTSEATRLQRQRSRNENSDDWIERWAAAEKFYFTKERPWESTDAVVEGE
jgi:uridine kinase